MTLLQIVETIDPEKATLIDEVLKFSSAAQTFGMGDGKGRNGDPDGWDRNKLLCSDKSVLSNLLTALNRHWRLASYYSDFSGTLVKASS